MIGVVTSTCVLAGCGSGEEPAATATPATAATPAATAAATATAATSATSTATTTATSPESEPGGAGDEQVVRVPVELTVHPDGQLSPATVSVPAFLTLELIIHNDTGASIPVSFQGERLVVASGATEHRRFEGLRKGRYAVRAAGAGTATVIAGVEPGP
ncbi:MAG TPA: hypothetical protein VH276_00835 [Solirubrobacteraceae bacterium]|nr:hypothetical protein [Solirubrobacteraceae bacterium]